MECPSNEDPLDVETCEKFDAWYDAGNTAEGNAVRVGDWSTSNHTYYNPIR